MSNPGDFLKAQFVIFRCQKYVKKTVHGNGKINLPWAFKNCPRCLYFTLLCTILYFQFFFSCLLFMLFVKYVNYFMDKKKKETEIWGGKLFSWANLRKSKIMRKKTNYYLCKIYVSIKVAGKNKFAENISTNNKHFHIKEAA